MSKPAANESAAASAMTEPKAMTLFCITFDVGKEDLPFDDDFPRVFHIQACDETGVYKWILAQLILHMETLSSPDIKLPTRLLDEVLNWIQYDFVQCLDTEVWTEEMVKVWIPDHLTEEDGMEMIKHCNGLSYQLKELAQEWIADSVDIDYVRKLDYAELQDALEDSSPGHFYHGCRSGLAYAIWDKSESFGIRIHPVVVANA